MKVFVGGHAHRDQLLGEIQLGPLALIDSLFQTARWIVINYASIAGCSLGIGDQRILCQLCRILRQMFSSL